MWQKQQPINIWDNVYYWIFEEYIERMNKRNDEEEKQRKKQDEEQKSQVPNMNNFGKGLGTSFKAPDYSKYLK